MYTTLHTFLVLSAGDRSLRTNNLNVYDFDLQFTR